MKTKLRKGIFIALLMICIVIVATGCGSQKPAETPKLGQINVNFDGINEVSFSCTNATTFDVKVNDVTKSVSGNSFKLNDTDTPIVSSQKIAITATAEGYESSSIVYNITFPPIVTKMVKKEGFLHWDAIPGFDKYKVRVDGVELDGTFDNQYELTAGKSVEIEVRPYKDNDSYNYYMPVFSQKEVCNILATPTNVRFDNATRAVTWNPVDKARGYVVKLVRDGEEVERKNIASNITQYIYDYTISGKYEVSVLACSADSPDNNDSKFSKPIEIIRLAAPTGIKCEDGTNDAININFTGVEGATNYLIKVDGVAQKPINVTSFKHVFERSDVQVTRQIEVYAIGDKRNVLDSVDAGKIAVTQLAIPKNVIISNGKIKWDTVAGNSGYILVFDGKNHELDHNEVLAESLNISEGAHSFTIKAKGNGTNVVSSWPTESKDIYKLQAPTGLACKNNLLTWDIVKNCTGYVVELGDVSVDNATSSSYEIKASDIKANTNIKIRAKGNGKEILDSGYSESYLIYKLETPNNLKTTNSNVEWDVSQNAKSYELKFNNITKHVDKGNSYSWNEIDAGSYKITVRAKGDGVKYIDSDLSKSIVVKKLETPVASVGEKSFEWSAIYDVARYEVAMQGELLYVNKTKTSYTKEFSEAGRYNFKVRAEGDGINTVTSNWSNEVIHQVKTLLGFTTSDFNISKIENGFRITLNKDIPNAVKYIVAVGGVENEVSLSDKTYDLIDNSAGSFIIKCKAVGDRFNYVDSNYSNGKTISTLPGVTNITWTDLQQDDAYMIKWDIVDKADSYTVKTEKFDLQGKLVGVFEDTMVDTELLVLTTDIAKIKVTIIANGNNETTFNSVPVQEILSK